MLNIYNNKELFETDRNSKWAKDQRKLNNRATSARDDQRHEVDQVNVVGCQQRLE